MRLSVLLAIVSCSLGAGFPGAHAQGPIEYDRKAAFLLNFTRYVEWPDERRMPPFQLCVLGDNPFGDRLEAAVQGEQWQGGMIEVREVPDVRRAADCHLLYVPVRFAKRFVSSAPQLADTPVLTVGEDEQFLEGGGMIQLFLEDETVRFSINQSAAQSAGLQISSRLLRLARRVVGARSSS